MGSGKCTTIPYLLLLAAAFCHVAQPAKIPGDSQWGPWSSCTRSCGRGTQLRTRTCSDMPQKSKVIGDEVIGRQCRESRACNTHTCPSTSGSWSPWSTCTKTCGGGTQTRTKGCFVRARTNEDEERAASVCQSENRRCNTQACQSDPSNPTTSKGGITFYGFSPKITVTESNSYKQFKTCERQVVRGASKFQKAKDCKDQILSKSRQTKVASRMTPCSNIPTFLPKVAAGLDSSILDFLAPPGAANGIENSVVTFTCDFGNKVTIGTVEYDLPDQIDQVYSESVHGFNLVEQIIETSSSVKVEKSRELSIDGAFKKISFSGSYSYKSMQSSLRTEEKKYIQYKYTLASLVVIMNYLPIDDSSSSSAAASYINSQLSGSTYIQKTTAYQNFVNIYGTHVSHRSRLGGLIHGSVSIETSYSETKSESEIKAEAKASFAKLLSISGVSVTTTTSVSTAFQQNSDTKISCFGGSASIGCTSLSIDTWLPSVEQNAHLLNSEALPASDYILDPTVKAGVDTAICRHIALVYFADLIHRINNINGLQSFAPALRNQYTTLRSQAQSYINTFNSVASASLHSSRCNQVFSFSDNAEDLMDNINEGGLDTMLAAHILPDYYMSATCPPDYSLSRFRSTYSVSKRDRDWYLYCSSSAFTQVHSSSCSYTTNYIHNYNANFFYQCPSSGAMTGIISIHDSYRRIEDRRYKFRCCSLSSTCSVSCTWTTNWTAREGAMDFHVPAGRYLAGAQTQVKIRTYTTGRWFWKKTYHITDRIWKFKTCQVVNC